MLGYEVQETPGRVETGCLTGAYLSLEVHREGLREKGYKLQHKKYC